MGTRRISRAVALLLTTLAACTPPKSKGADQAPATGTAAPAVTPGTGGWIEWLATDASGLKWLEAEPGWTSFYKRRYRESIAGFGAAPATAREKVGLARAHLEMGQFEFALLRLLSATQLDYFDARAKLGDSAPPLQLGPYYRGLALLTAGKPEGASMLADVQSPIKEKAAFVKAIAKPCGRAAAGESQGGFVARAYRCWVDGQPPPACPDKAGSAPADDEWGRRIQAYYGAVCGPSAADDARLLALVRKPAEEETTAQTKAGDATIKGGIAYFDLVGVWALAIHHARQVEPLLDPSQPGHRALIATVRALLRAPPVPDGATAGNVGPEVLVFSSWKDAADMKTGPAKDGDEPTAVLLKAEALSAGVHKALEAGGDSLNRKTVQQLGLEPSYADGLVRRAAGEAMKRGDAVGALRLYRATMDPSVAEQVTYRNEPMLFVHIAEGSLVLHRDSDLIGDLRALRASYPEAEGVLSAANALAVVRSIGGNHNGGPVQGG